MKPFIPFFANFCMTIKLGFREFNCIKRTHLSQRKIQLRYIVHLMVWIVRSDGKEQYQALQHLLKRRANEISDYSS